jgi:hypothetical protein
MNKGKTRNILEDCIFDAGFCKRRVNIKQSEVCVRITHWYSYWGNSTKHLYLYYICNEFNINLLKRFPCRNTILII